MHVSTETKFSAAELMERLQGAATDGLTFKPGRTPPKFWLHRFPGTLPTAAEVAVNEAAENAVDQESTTELVLRLMWGPLPAPFPRAVAAIGLLLAVALLTFSSRGAPDWALAAILIIVPGVALLYQRAGEQELQAKLESALSAPPFKAKAH